MANGGPRPSQSVFLNIPYDTRYERLYVALIAGLSMIGLVPRSALEVPPVGNRLTRIVDLMRGCRYSVHDISRIQLSHAGGFRCPRFNMPFEAGIAMALGLGRNHQPFILEEVRHRMDVSLSDLRGIDPRIHGGTVVGILRAVLDMFGRPGGRVQVQHLQTAYRALRDVADTLEQEFGGLYTRTSFSRLVTAADEVALGLRRSQRL